MASTDIRLQEIEITKLNLAKWKKRKSKTGILKYLLPSAVNGAIMIILDLPALNITSLRTSAELAVYYDLFLLLVAAVVWVPCRLMERKYFKKLQKLYTGFASSFP